MSHLIGIVRAYLPYTDLAISQQTGQLRMILHENSGLAEAHPVDYINETTQEARRKSPRLQQQWDAAMALTP